MDGHPASQAGQALPSTPILYLSSLSDTFAAASCGNVTLLLRQALRRRMKQMELRWKRPRYVYPEKGPNIAQKKGLLYGNYGDFHLILSCYLEMKPPCASFRLCAIGGHTKASRRLYLLPVKTLSAYCLAPLILRPAIA